MSGRVWTDAELSAFLDGELAPTEMEALSLALETDAGLAARMERLGSANTAYLGAIGAIDGAPMKASLKAAMETPPTAKVIAFQPRSLGAFVTQHRAIAASLVCAAAVWGLMSSMAGPGADDPLAPGADGMIVASSPVHRMLETGRTGEVVTISAGVSATPRLTFASDDGGFCRQFDVMNGESASAAIACREGDGWKTQVVAYGLPKPSGDFQTASAARSPVLEAFLDQRMSGAPMNAEDEAKLLAGGWKAE
jgi:hypothetical protein